MPGLILLLTTPAILYFLYPPEVKETPDAPEAARKELEKLGAFRCLLYHSVSPLCHHYHYGRWPPTIQVGLQCRFPGKAQCVALSFEG